MGFCPHRRPAPLSTANTSAEALVLTAGVARERCARLYVASLHVCMCMYMWLRVVLAVHINLTCDCFWRIKATSRGTQRALPQIGHCKPAAHWFGGWAAQDPTAYAFHPIIGTTLAAPLLQPPIVRNDPLLRVETGRVVADDFSFNARAFNGGSPGPTIIVRPGTQFTVTLQNGEYFRI